MSEIKYTNDDYTIGWICPLDIELAAAMGMLDEEHPELLSAPGDSNTYTLGKIQKHNVVLAALPSGTLGNNVAATVAANVLRSFPKIRFGLLVGIGGGVPSNPMTDPEKDLRLGDVVVSDPGNGHSGVLQYDFGQTMKEGKFIQRGTLNKPPETIRTAITKIKAEHLRKRSKIPTFLAAMIQANPKMSRQYGRPEPDSDQLFRLEYDHEDDDALRKDCQSHDEQYLLHRENRPTNDPVIHYGLIGSANQVMKHGRTRERLRQDKGILCFEMEAAGLMDNFPCVIIRGICDYSDTHKNDRWQPYAAATAAAYAKELLQTISPVKVDQSDYALGVMNLG